MDFLLPYNVILKQNKNKPRYLKAINLYTFSFSFSFHHLFPNKNMLLAPDVKS